MSGFTMDGVAATAAAAAGAGAGAYRPTAVEDEDADEEADGEEEEEEEELATGAPLLPTMSSSSRSILFLPPLRSRLRA